MSNVFLMDEENRKPIIINGRPIKSINQFYNKKRKKIQAELSKLGACHSSPSATNQGCSVAVPSGEAFLKDLIHITDVRNEKINDYMPEGAKRSFHKASRFAINYCLDNKIGQIVIGKNSGWKQDINLGKRNNQNFVAIPFT